jgi:hypothetical protein
MLRKSSDRPLHGVLTCSKVIEINLDGRRFLVTVDCLKSALIHLLRAENYDSVIYDTRQRNTCFRIPSWPETRQRTLTCRIPQPIKAQENTFWPVAIRFDISERLKTHEGTSDADFTRALFDLESRSTKDGSDESATGSNLPLASRT